MNHGRISSEQGSPNGMKEAHMSWDIACWKERVGVVHDIVVTLAALAGGSWALLRFKRERSDESALDLEVSVKSEKTSTANTFAVFVEAKLKNVGKTKIQAKPTTKGSVAYGDADEKIAYSGSLLVRSVSVPAAIGYLNWYDKTMVKPIPDLDEIDMLSEYEIPDKDSLLEFWMEPGETYTLGKTIMLTPGLYLAKVTFIGARNDGDFWTRLVQFSVPAS
jgi:hypothetical protein